MIDFCQVLYTQKTHKFQNNLNHNLKRLNRPLPKNLFKKYILLRKYFVFKLARTSTLVGYSLRVGNKIIVFNF